jgi:hypothetical protein
MESGHGTGGWVDWIKELASTKDQVHETTWHGKLKEKGIRRKGENRETYLGSKESRHHRRRPQLPDLESGVVFLCCCYCHHRCSVLAEAFSFSG